MPYDTIGTMEKLSLKLATLKDIQDLSRLEQAIFPTPWSLQAFQEAFDAGKEFCIAYLDGQPMGYCGLFNTIDTAEILNIGVLAEQRGKGVGATLLGYAITRARIWGCEKLCLEVRESNLPARHFYEKQGFKQLAVRKNYYPSLDLNNPSLEAAIIMVYFLDN